MSVDRKVIKDVESALESDEPLDKALVRELLEHSKALEVGLADACRTNLEMSAMDKNVVAATNSLKDAYGQLLKAFTTRVEIDESTITEMVEAQLDIGRQVAETSESA